jgi:serine/threonine-protein kinase RsbW
MDCIELKLSPTLQQTSLATLAVASIARAYYTVIKGTPCPPESDFVNAVELAVGEACTNCVKHRHRENDRLDSIRVCFELEENQMVVKVQDQNPSFDFENTPVPDLEQIPESGYGIQIMKKTMDEVKYRYENGWNIIILKKSLSEEETK